MLLKYKGTISVNSKLVEANGISPCYFQFDGLFFVSFYSKLNYFQNQRQHLNTFVLKKKKKELQCLNFWCISPQGQRTKCKVPEALGPDPLDKPIFKTKLYVFSLTNNSF